MNRLALAFCLAALEASFGAGAALAKTLPNHDFVIKKGKHTARRGLPTRGLRFGRKQRRVTFQVLFPASAAYRTANPSNQGDACKLLGISTNNIHGTSIRLGWAWDPGANLMTLRFYGYLNKQRVNEVLTKVPLNQWVNAELRMGNDGMSAQAGDKKLEKKQNLGFRGTTMTWILYTAYFGGDEKAPQDITVKVRNIRFE